MSAKPISKVAAKRFVYAGIATSFSRAAGWDPTDFLGLDDRTEADATTLMAALDEIVAELKTKAFRAQPRAKRARPARHATSCAWCSGPLTGRRTREMHPGCYAKAWRCGALERRRLPRKRDPATDHLDALIEAVIRRKVTT